MPGTKCGLLNSEKTFEISERAKNFSQKELAFEANIEVRQISRIENGVINQAFEMKCSLKDFMPTKAFKEQIDKVGRIGRNKVRRSKISAVLRLFQEENFHRF